MTELTLEALQHFMLENGSKVKSSDAIEFFRLNFGGKVNDLSHNKDLFKKYMEQLTRADITENGERFLVLKRQHMVPVSPHPYRSPNIGRSSQNSSPRLLIRAERSQTTPPRSPRVSVPRSETRVDLPGSAPSALETGTHLIVPQQCRKPSTQETVEDDGLRSPVSGYDSEEFDEDDAFDDMELGSVGGCSNNQLEPNQKEWIYKTAIGDLDSVTRLLLQDRTLVKYKDFISGYTGLHWACKLGRLDMVHVLISADSDVNSRAFNGMVPLHMAAQCGHEDVIDLLIKEKADKLTRDNNGKLPAFYLPIKTSDRIKELLAPPPPLTTKVRRHESLSQGIRRRMTAMSRSRKVSGSFTRPVLTRRPSTSSLDDTIKRTRSNSDTGSVSKNSKKQYMSLPVKKGRSARKGLPHWFS